MNEAKREYYQNGNAVEVWISSPLPKLEAEHQISKEWTRLNMLICAHHFSNDLMWFRNECPVIRHTNAFSGPNDQQSYVKLTVSLWENANMMAEPTELINFLEQNGYREM